MISNPLIGKQVHPPGAMDGEVNESLMRDKLSVAAMEDSPEALTSQDKGNDDATSVYSDAGCDEVSPESEALGDAEAFGDCMSAYKKPAMSLSQGKSACRTND